MEKIWNDFSLKKPPFITLTANYSHSVLKLHAVIDNYFSKYAKYEVEFMETAALLSRLMARRKNSFNKMKGFKDICKLNAALCRLLRVDFKRDLESFRNTLPDVEFEEGTSIQLPTRDSFDFVLIRLISVYELYKRIGDCCVSAAEYFASQIRVYFFFEISTLMLAVVAKIHSMSIKLLNLAADLYNNCLPHRIGLPVNSKSKFLNDSSFEFPDKLEIVKLNTREITAIAAKDQPLKDLLHQEEKLEAVKAKKLKRTDIGEEVQRTSNVAEKRCDIDKLKSVEDVKRFIAVESKLRSNNSKSSTTTKILSHEWAGATKLFERKVQNGEVKKAINIFRKFISSKVL